MALFSELAADLAADTDLLAMIEEGRPHHLRVGAGVLLILQRIGAPRRGVDNIRELLAIGHHGRDVADQVSTFDTDLDGMGQGENAHIRILLVADDEVFAAGGVIALPLLAAAQLHSPAANDPGGRVGCGLRFGVRWVWDWRGVRGRVESEVQRAERYTAAWSGVWTEMIVAVREAFVV